MFVYFCIGVYINVQTVVQCKLHFHITAVDFNKILMINDNDPFLNQEIKLFPLLFV